MPLLAFIHLHHFRLEGRWITLFGALYGLQSDLLKVSVVIAVHAIAPLTVFESSKAFTIKLETLRLLAVALVPHLLPYQRR